MTHPLPPDWLPTLARIESSNRPYVKAKTSSASGLYQFTRTTWEGLGGKWGLNPDEAFGGLFPSEEEQSQRATTLSETNAGFLVANELEVSSANLYACHFLGPVRGCSILRAPDEDPVEDHVAASAVLANPFLKPMTVADFKAWLTQKVTP